MKTECNDDKACSAWCECKVLLTAKAYKATGAVTGLQTHSRVACCCPCTCPSLCCDSCCRCWVPDERAVAARASACTVGRTNTSTSAQQQRYVHRRARECHDTSGQQEPNSGKSATLATRLGRPSTQDSPKLVQAPGTVSSNLSATPLSPARRQEQHGYKQAVEHPAGVALFASS